MKAKILIMIGIVSLLLLTGCCTTNTNRAEVNAVCIPYCNSKNMSLERDSTVVCTNTITCACEGVPKIREVRKR